MTRPDRPRAEHLAWCKQRALQYVDAGNLADAIASMLSDMQKHPETAGIARMMAPIGMFEAMNGTPSSVRRFIEGFN